MRRTMLFMPGSKPGNLLNGDVYGADSIIIDLEDAVALAENAGLDLPPVMIYSDDLTHVVTEEGIAYLHKCTSMADRMAAIRAVAGFTEVGMAEDPAETAALRERGEPADR